MISMFKSRINYIFKNWGIWCVSHRKPKLSKLPNYAHTFSNYDSSIINLFLRSLGEINNKPKDFYKRDYQVILGLELTSLQISSEVNQTPGVIMKVLDIDGSGYICLAKWIWFDKVTNKIETRVARGWISKNFFDLNEVKVALGTWIRVIITKES